MASTDRRLAAIMFTDIVGFSAMMAADEARALKCISEQRAQLLVLLAEHKGTLHKEMGDGTMCSFASARQAADCAHALQERIAAAGAFQIRVGLHIGDVVFSGDDILGDGVNIAARIEPLAAPGGIAASKPFVDAVRSQSHVQFESIGLRELKNIGVPMEIFAAKLSGSNAAAASAAARVPVAEKPSIAVLRFSALADDERIALLADGLAEDIITLLARVPGFLVISRASSLNSRRGDESAANIAQQLGVRYVVEGSVRPVGERLRVTTQLTDASSARVIWSGRFEVGRDETEDLQDAIVRGIFSELEPELTRAEIALIRRQRPENLDAWACYRQGAGTIGMKGWTREAMAEALPLLRRAYAIDPNFNLARAHFALIHALGIRTGVLPQTPDAEAEIREVVQKAVSEDDQNSDVLGYAGCALVDLGDPREGIDILARAIELDPSNAQAHVAYGAALTLVGELDAGIERVRHGMRISPRDRRLGFWGWGLGRALLRAGRAEEALREARNAAARDPKSHLARILEAAILLELGREDEAKAVIGALKRLRPDLGIEEIAMSHGRGLAARLAPYFSNEQGADFRS